MDEKPIQRRKRPTMKTKLRVLCDLRKYYEKYGDNYPRTHFEKQSGWSKSSISEWLSLDRMRQVATLPWLACCKRLRTVVVHERSQFASENDELYKRFLYRRRARGQEVDVDWFKDTMKKILFLNKPPGYEKFQCSPGWLEKFLKRYCVSNQMQTEKKQMCNSLRVPLLQGFHIGLCRIQQSHGLNPRDPIYGRFSPLAIWNVDQIPFSFIKSHRRSYNPIGEACWILNQGPSGLEKRMATIILTLRGDGPQIVPPFILFRGEGRISAALLAELDAVGIPYGFNEKAWANQDACIAHLNFFNKIVRETCPELKEHMLLLDGLSSQSTRAFIELALDLNIYTVYFPPNCTHLVQPVDHRVAAWLKAAFHTFYKFEEEEKYEIWADYRANGSLSLPQLRETLLRWVAAAWAELKKMPTFLQKAFVLVV